MTIKSGNATQVGFAVETTAGSAVSPTFFLPVRDESLAVTGGRATSEAIYAGTRVLRSDQWNGGNFKVAGDVQMELRTAGLGYIFQAMFGAVATTGSGTFTHTFTPGDLPTLTVQAGRPTTAGIAVPFTYAGAKVASWEIAAKEGAVATLGTTFSAMRGEGGTRNVSDGVTTNGSATFTSVTAAFTDADAGKTITATGIPAGTRILSVQSGTSVTLSANATAAGTALATSIGMPLVAASYAAGTALLKCNHLSVSVAGAPVKVTDATFAGDNAVVDRHFAGTRWPDVPLEDTGALRSYTGTLDVEFTDMAMYDRFISGAEVAVSAVFAAKGASVTLAGNARFDENSPAGSGRDLLKQKLAIVFIASSTDASAMTCTLVNTDAMP